MYIVAFVFPDVDLSIKLMFLSVGYLKVTFDGKFSSVLVEDCSISEVIWVLIEGTLVVFIMLRTALSSLLICVDTE